jgi:hypothetical protein
MTARYVVQAETGSEAEHRVRNAIKALGKTSVTDAELTALQLYPGEVRLEPAEHG